LIVDTSALIAILRDEPEARTFLSLIDTAPSKGISAVNFVETAIVVESSRDPIASRRFDELCRDLGLIPMAVDETQARLAREAYRDFGEGSGHPAQLNFGDCFAYALAKSRNEPLLFKGDDFSCTDVALALPARLEP